MVKILAISDQVVDHLYSPSVKEQFGDVSLVVGCGDLPYYYLEFVVSMLNVPLVHVPGNHDLPPTVSSAGRDPAICSHIAEGCGNIDGLAVEEQGLLLAGLGGSIRYRPDGVNQYTQTEMACRILALVPRLYLNRVRHGRFLDILITHSPPRGVHDGTDPAHVGFTALNRFIARFQPRYLLHGHSHVYRRDVITKTQVGPTTILNVCPYRVIELDAGHAG
jgi:Icc-related predicted phosphoesterase